MPASDEQVIDGIGRRDLIPTPWMFSAACLGIDPAVFFVDVGDSGDEAKATCAKCPVRVPCLDFALQTSERYGIWGGLTFKQRRVEARRRKEAA